MRPVLVGIAPSRPGAEGQPLSALGGRSTGATLAAMSGLSNLGYMSFFDRVNLCPTVRSSTIAVREGRPMAQMLAGSLLRGRTVVLLGANVATCFDVQPMSYRPCEWFDAPPSPNAGVAGYKPGHCLPFRFAVLPHPSGRNRWYNEPANREAATNFMQRLVVDHKRIPL